MMRAILLGLINAVVLAVATVRANEVQTPSTSAGRVFNEWLAIANHPDREAMASFIRKYQWSMELDQEMGALTQDGGYDLVAVEQSKPDVFVARVRSRTDGAQLLAKIVVSGTPSIKMLFLGLYDDPGGTPYQPYSLDATSNRAVVSAVLKSVSDMYVDREVGERLSNMLATKLKAGAYDKFSEGELLAQAVNDDLHQVSHDLHLNVLFYLVPQPSIASPTPLDPQQVRLGLAKHNCGFVRAEHIEPNIGYLKFDSFALPDVCGDTASAAMRFVADSAVIIFDLRDNGGGVPAMVAYLESYLFDKATHLNDVYFRQNDETHQFWTLPYVPGKRVASVPVYVLTSKNTFSAAEEFAYTLQALKRATIVGETTAGGAHPYDTVQINSHFTVEVPFARSVNPMTKKDWEGAGVVPDEKVPASDALERAVSLARKSLKTQ